MHASRVSLLVTALLLLVGGLFWYTNFANDRSAHDATVPPPLTATRLPLPPAIEPMTAIPSRLLEPIDEFKERITKKPFGIFITPETSPIQPDRFSGYHTGVDIEYGDVAGDVPVYAITDGTVLISRFASGYGGVTVIRHTREHERPLLVLYGHLDPNTLLPPGDTVVRGQRIGILGEGETHETDGARKHLHFALIKGDTPRLAGYVASQDALEDWYDPITFYGSRPTELN